MGLQRISKGELQRRLREEERRENVGAIKGVNGNPLNSRKQKGASKKVMQSMLLAKLYKDGVIERHEDGSYTIHEYRADEYRGGDSTHATVRTILRQVRLGFESMGVKVHIRRILSDANDTTKEHHEDEAGADRSDSERRDDSGSVQFGSHGGVRAGGREDGKGDPREDRDTDRDSESSERG